MVLIQPQLQLEQEQLLIVCHAPLGMLVRVAEMIQHQLLTINNAPPDTFVIHKTKM